MMYRAIKTIAILSILYSSMQTYTMKQEKTINNLFKFVSEENITGVKRILALRGLIKDLLPGGNTILHTAIHRGNKQIIDTILIRCSNKDKEFLDIQNESGNTAAHIAAMCGNIQALLALKAAGINLHLLNEKNQYFVDVAKEHNNTEFLNHFKSWKKNKGRNRRRNEKRKRNKGKCKKTEETPDCSYLLALETNLTKKKTSKKRCTKKRTNNRTQKNNFIY